MPILNIREMGSIGVVSDVAPWDLPPAAFSDGMNFRLVSGKVQTTGGIESVSVNAGQGIGHITQSTDLKGNSSWIVCGERSILMFNGSDFFTLTGIAAERLKNTINVDPSAWSSAKIGNVSFFNNPELVPIYWADEGESASPSELKYLPWHIGVNEENELVTETWADVGMGCNIIRSHKNFLFALGINNPKGQFNDMVHWSHPADPNGIPFSWRPTIQQPDSIAGAVSMGRGGAITSGESLRDSFVIYSEEALNVMDFTGDALGWRRRAISETAGLANKNSIVEVKGTHILFSGSDILSYDGNSLQSLMHNRLRSRLAANVNMERINNSWAAHYQAHNEVWFGVPENGADHPNYAYCFNYRDNTWSIRDLERQVIHARAGKEPKAAYLTWGKAVTGWDDERGSWSQAGDRPFREVIYGLANEMINDLDPSMSTAGGGSADYSDKSWDGVCPDDTRSRATSGQLESWVENAKVWNADTRKWDDAPIAKPSAPTNVIAGAGDATASLTWTAPSSNGGSPVVEYTATASPSGKTVVTQGGTSCNFTGLVNGTQYTFTVKARNEAGYGDESAPSNAVTPEAEIVTGRPSAPLNVTADAGDAYAVVSWSAPADDGGLPITEYAVTSSPSGIVVTTGGNTSCRFNGLVNDTEYTFTVTAKNNEGVSDASAPSNPVTPESGVIDPPNPDEGSWIAAVGSWNEEVIGTWNDGQIEPIEPTDCSWVSMEDSWNDFSPLATYERSGTYLLRTDLPIGGHETNTTITRVYPYVEGTAKLEFRFGSQQHAGGPVSWVGGFREFSPGKDRKIDVRTTGELHAYEVRSKDGFFKLTGMDIEYSMAGVR